MAIDLDKKKLGPKYRKYANAVEVALEALGQAEREKLANKLENDGVISLDIITSDSSARNGELGNDLISIVKHTRVENVREYTPNVIEPAFGIGRILYSVLEHVYWHRQDEVARGVSRTM